MENIYTGIEDPNGGIAEHVELGFNPSHEIHGFLQRPCKLLPVFHQHVVVRFLH